MAAHRCWEEAREAASWGRSLQGSLLLVYLSLRPGQLARSLAGAVAHLPPELRNRRSAAPALAPPV